MITVEEFHSESSETPKLNTMTSNKVWLHVMGSGPNLLPFSQRDVSKRCDTYAHTITLNIVDKAIISW